MRDFLRDNWFVVVIAVVIIGFVSYFIYDSTKYNVSGTTSDGEDVVASTNKGDVTADDLYDEMSASDSSLLYNLYRNEVVDQSIETTDDLQQDADDLKDQIDSTAEQQVSDYKSYLGQELAAYGYNGYDELDDYCLMSVKQKEMNRRYVKKHYDDLKKAVEDQNPRTISIIQISVSDPDNLTSDEQKKKDNIDSALSKQSFAKTATAYSEDSTASDEGVYGYVDGKTTESSSSSLDESVINAALDLKKGETSDWITVTDSDSGTSYLYKVHVDETDLDTIYKSKNDTIKDQVLNAFLTDNTGLEYTVVQSYAKKLDIKLSKSTKKKINAYIEEQKKGDDSSDEEN